MSLPSVVKRPPCRRRRQHGANDCAFLAPRMPPRTPHTTAGAPIVMESSFFSLGATREMPAEIPTVRHAWDDKANGLERKTGAPFLGDGGRKDSPDAAADWRHGVPFTIKAQSGAVNGSSTCCAGIHTRFEAHMDRSAFLDRYSRYWRPAGAQRRLAGTTAHRQSSEELSGHCGQRQPDDLTFGSAFSATCPQRRRHLLW